MKYIIHTGTLNYDIINLIMLLVFMYLMEMEAHESELGTELRDAPMIMV